MTKFRTIRSLALFAALIAAASCTKDLTGDTAAPDVDPAVHSKLVFSSQNAIKGELLVYFDEEAVTNVEESVLCVTRAGGLATRSGINDFDAVLENIGVKSLSRLFPVDSRNEERTRAAGLHRWYIVEFNEDTDLDNAALAMARVAQVNKVEFNQQLRRIIDTKSMVLDEEESAPANWTRSEEAPFNDPHLSKQWHYINTGDKNIYSGIKAGADVNCKEAWRYCTGNPNVIVAIVDDCVQWDHPDLEANMWVNTAEQNGQSGVDDDNNGYKDDLHGYNFVTNTTNKISSGDIEEASHGTHVAGTVAAVNNNGTGVCGIAGGSGNNDGVKLMSCQIFYNGSGGSSSISSRAIKYAADNGASIIQCSWGYEAGYITSDSSYASYESAEKQAIDYFIATKNCDAIDGGLVIFAAGNDMMGMSGYPAAFRDYISVTAMSCDYTPAYYTNYGPGCNIAAPGGDLYQSYLETYTSQSSGIYSTFINGRYGYSQGTSMACPHVSGVAALGLSYALQLGKTFTVDQFKSILLTSANDISPYCTGSKPYINANGSYATLQLAPYAGKMGSGYIDAYQVLMNVRGTTCIPVPTGSQYTLDIYPYIGGGSLDMTITAVEISAEDKARVGMSSNPTIFSNKILLTCTKTGSAIAKITLQVGTNSGNGINGMTITKEFALIAREHHAENGGWL